MPPVSSEPHTTVGFIQQQPADQQIFSGGRFPSGWSGWWGSETGLWLDDTHWSSGTLTLWQSIFPPAWLKPVCVYCRWSAWSTSGRHRLNFTAGCHGYTSSLGLARFRRSNQPTDRLRRWTNFMQDSVSALYTHLTSRYGGSTALDWCERPRILYDRCLFDFYTKNKSEEGWNKARGHYSVNARTGNLARIISVYCLKIIIIIFKKRNFRHQ